MLMSYSSCSLVDEQRGLCIYVAGVLPIWHCFMSCGLVISQLAAANCKMCVYTTSAIGCFSFNLCLFKGKKLWIRLQGIKTDTLHHSSGFWLSLLLKLALAFCVITQSCWKRWIIFFFIANYEQSHREWSKHRC